jgi:hypothetical protein
MSIIVKQLRKIYNNIISANCTQQTVLSVSAFKTILIQQILFFRVCFVETRQFGQIRQSAITTTKQDE